MELEFQCRLDVEQKEHATCRIQLTLPERSRLSRRVQFADHCAGPGSLSGKRSPRGRVCRARLDNRKWPPPSHCGRTLGSTVNRSGQHIYSADWHHVQPLVSNTDPSGVGTIRPIPGNLSIDIESGPSRFIANPNNPGHCVRRTAARTTDTAAGHVLQPARQGPPVSAVLGRTPREGHHLNTGSKPCIREFASWLWKRLRGTCTPVKR